MPGTHTHLPVADRRSPSLFNRGRRFLNNYWLVPVFVLYLQFLAALMSLHDGQAVDLAEKNRAFFTGIPLFVEILGTDFPYGVIGHGKELLHAMGGDEQLVTPLEVAAAVERRKHEILLVLQASREEHHTEQGGVLTVDPNTKISLAPIPSSNGRFLTELMGLTPAELGERLQGARMRTLISAISGDTQTLDRILGLLANTEIPQDAKDLTLDSYLFSLRTTSEARYVLLPLEFKAALGRLPAWRYAGIYHFHNEFDSPPSDADMEASFHARQFVFCLTRDGFLLYDIAKGDVTVSHHPVDPEGHEPGPDAQHIHRI